MIAWEGPPSTFLQSEIDYSKAKYVIIPVPYDSTVFNMPGTRFGPREIIYQSRNIDGEAPVYTLNEIEVNRGDVEDTIRRVNDTVKQVLRDGKFPIIIGGEHSISIGAADAFDADVVIFDAHDDMKDEFEGCKYSHACTAKRISEHHNVYIIGARVGISHNINEVLKLIKGKKVYISIDMDVLDPSIAPGVGTPEPQGLTYTELLDMVKSIFEVSDVVGFDVVECNPLVESVRTPYIAARIVYSMIKLKEQII